MRQTIHFFGRNFRCRDVAFFRCSNAHHSTPACRPSARRALHDHCLINKVRFDPSIDSKGKSLSLLMTPGYGVNERRDSGLPNLFVSNIVRRVTRWQVDGQSAGEVRSRCRAPLSGMVGRL
jgi:hypothetical protein